MEGEEEMLPLEWVPESVAGASSKRGTFTE